MDILSVHGRRITQSTDDKHESAFLFQRLSVLIQRYNAIAVLVLLSRQPSRMTRSRSSIYSSFQLFLLALWIYITYGNRNSNNVVANYSNFTWCSLTWSWCSRRRERRTLRVRWVYSGWLLAGSHRGRAARALAPRCTRSAWCRDASASCRRCADHRPSASETARKPEAGRWAGDRRRWTRRRELHGSRSGDRRCSPGCWRLAAESGTRPGCWRRRTSQPATAESSSRRRPPPPPHGDVGQGEGLGDARSGTGSESAGLDWKGGRAGKRGLEQSLAVNDGGWRRGRAAERLPPPTTSYNRTAINHDHKNSWLATQSKMKLNATAVYQVADLQRNCSETPATETSRLVPTRATDSELMSVT